MAQPTQPTNKKDSVKGNAEDKLDILESKSSKPTDAMTNTHKLPPHYTLTIEGSALIAGEEKEYEVSINVPDLGEGKGDGHYMTFVLSSERGDLLRKSIRKHYGQCELIRTHSLVDRVYHDGTGNVHAVHSSVTPGEKITLDQMRKPEMIQLVKEMKYPINTELYSRPDELRDAIKLCTSDREEFLAKQQHDLDELRIKQESEALNADL